VGVEGDAVDDGGDEARVGEHSSPFAERQICGDGGSFLSFGDDLEQELGAAGDWEMHRTLVDEPAVLHFSKRSETCLTGIWSKAGGGSVVVLRLADALPRAIDGD
jgi:hypothetical protein